MSGNASQYDNLQSDTKNDNKSFLNLDEFLFNQVNQNDKSFTLDNAVIEEADDKDENKSFDHTLLGELEESNTLMLSDISIEKTLDRKDIEKSVINTPKNDSPLCLNSDNLISRKPSTVIKKSQIKFKKQG